MYRSPKKRAYVLLQHIWQRFKKSFVDLANNPNKYQVWIFKEKMLEPIVEMGLEVNNDTKILACAIDCDKHAYLDRINFYTNDLSLKNMAQLFFCKECIKSILFCNTIPHIFDKK